MNWLYQSWLCRGRNRRTQAQRPGLEILEDRAQPAAMLDPVYSATFSDAITADEAFVAKNGQRYWTIEAGADDYQNDVYERPTAQTYEVRKLADGSKRFAAAEYFENLDIEQARVGFDDTFLYVAVDMQGLNKSTADGKNTLEGLVYRYGFRLSLESDGGHGLLVVADQPALKNSPSTTFASVGTFVYRDVNGDVGGTGLDVTKEDNEGEVAGNGYELKVVSDGKADNGARVLWVRIDPNDPTVVEFALDYRAFGFTQSDLSNLPYLEFEANKGLQDPGNYLWNDEYNQNEAGSPYQATSGDTSKSEFGTQGLGNIYELDTLRGGPLTPPAAASLSGFVYFDENLNSVRDDGEIGIVGVTLILTNSDGMEIGTTVTGSDGSYSFTALATGTYTITEVQPIDYFDGGDNVGTVNGEERGVLLDNDILGEILLEANEHGIDYNFGEREPPGG